MNIHCIGICGQGVSSIAGLLLSQGHRVTGYDAAWFPVVEALEKKGAVITIGDIPGEVPANTEMIITSGSARYGENHPHKIAARERNIPIHTYTEYLGILSKKQPTISVCGTHGKTTTIGMLATSMTHLRHDPTLLGGAYIPQWNRENYRGGDGKYLLIESCEYQKNFHNYHPEIILCTNTELDHTNFYTSEAMYDDAFVEFFTHAEAIYFHAGDTRTKTNAERAKEINNALKLFPAEASEDVQLNVIGDHNQQNAQLVQGFLQSHFNHTSTETQSALQEFRGTARRQEFIGEINGIKVYDDYGHHPTAMRETIAAFRAAHLDQQIAAIWEYLPTRSALDPDFIQSLSMADFVGVLPPFKFDGAIDAEMAKNVCQKAPSFIPLVDNESFEKLVNQLRPGDILLGMGPRLVSQYLRERVE